jgi:hypothetical protein
MEAIPTRPDNAITPDNPTIKMGVRPVFHFFFFLVAWRSRSGECGWTRADCDQETCVTHLACVLLAAQSQGPRETSQDQRRQGGALC